MRIVHIISGDLWAGAEVAAYNILRTLKDRAGVEFSAILFNDGKLCQEIYKLGIPLMIIDERKNSFIKMLKLLQRHVEATLPDIIHSHRSKENILSFLASRKLKHTRLIAVQQGLPEAYGSSHNIKYLVESTSNFFILSRAFDCTVAVSEDVKRALIGRYGFAEGKIRVIHNGVDIPANPIFIKRDRYFKVGSIGRLFPVKDYPLMVELAKFVYEKDKEARFELAGTGPEEEKIKRMILKYGLENVFSMRGFVDNLASFYGSVDLYINTSLHEGLPLSILEAMSYGIPAIAPRVGGIIEIIDDGISGCLVDSRKPAAFAEKCIALRKDEPLRIRMGEAARAKIISGFSAAKMADAYYKLYHEIKK